MQRASEPSVEEILQSIKRVIARENREIVEQDRERMARLDHAGETESQAESYAIGREDEAVLELTDEAPRTDSSEPGDGLIRAEAEAAMRNSLSALAMLAEPNGERPIARTETSLEGLVRELLRPMLAEWLDRNLPDMVERMVAGEIARIVGKQP